MLVAKYCEPLGVEIATMLLPRAHTMTSHNLVVAGKQLMMPISANTQHTFSLVLVV
nr:unnamed protein product [Callosobruchus chinensis]